MKLKTIFTIIALGFVLSSYSQKATIEITFTSDNFGSYVPLDSVFINNITQGGDTTIYFPDTVLLLDYTTTGLGDAFNQTAFRVSQNYPNPFQSRTGFEVFLPENGNISIIAHDLRGREVANLSGNYSAANHIFSFNSAREGFYIVSVRFNDRTHSMKMYCLGENSDGVFDISYGGNGNNGSIVKSGKAKSGFTFNLGDQLVAFGYFNNMFRNALIIPTQDTLIKFSFQGPGLCPATFTDARDNTVYTTVQIGVQCWMGHNLAYLPSVSPADSGSVDMPYFYVYDYDSTIVAEAKATYNYQTYGVLYNWAAAMNGATSSDSVPSGVQGICPAGWHLPGDEEWKILEGEVDNAYGYPDPEWDGTGYRGIDASSNLKEAGNNHWKIWQTLTSTNSSGFTGLPGGTRSTAPKFTTIYTYGYFWTSRSENSTEAWYRSLPYHNSRIYRNVNAKEAGFSIRCLKY